MAHFSAMAVSGIMKTDQSLTFLQKVGIGEQRNKPNKKHQIRKHVPKSLCMFCNLFLPFFKEVDFISG